MPLQQFVWQLEPTAASTGITIDFMRISLHSHRFGEMRNPQRTKTRRRVNMQDILSTLSSFIGRKERFSQVFGFLPETCTGDRQHKPCPLAGNSRFAERDTGDPKDIRREK